MQFRDICRHLKPYSIVANRTTTINHAFASCISASDTFDLEKVRAAIVALKQDPDKDLVCGYCGLAAGTWDHVHATVKKGEFSGYGNKLGNLLPCCKSCNSRKGNKHWLSYLEGMELPDTLQVERSTIISSYLKIYGAEDSVPRHLPEYKELQQLKSEVLAIFLKADILAKVIRNKSLTYK